MKIQLYTNYTTYKNFNANNASAKNCSTKYSAAAGTATIYTPSKNYQKISFNGNPFSEINNIIKFFRAKRKVSDLKKYMEITNGSNNFVLRELAMEPFEGLQYGIDAFKGLTMKEIQYLCENLHVIAVKRGCNNMCGYCYADAKPSESAMSWEDFTIITRGMKTLKKRFKGLDIFGENFQISSLNFLRINTFTDTSL